jgi:hypothetical protein
MFLISLLLASVFGIALLRLLFWSRRAVSRQQQPMEYALGPGLGLALLSAFRFWWLVCGLPAAMYPWTEALLVAAAVIVAARAPRPAAEALPQERDPRWGKVLVAVVVAGQLILVGLGFWHAYVETPDGLWDAWCFWNTKARFLYAGGEHWRLAVDSAAVHHSDYPLLLPLTVVRAWDWNGSASAAAGFFVGAFFFALTTWLLFALVWSTRGPIQGFLALGVYLSTPLVFRWSASQYADIPLAYYYLAAIGSLFLSQEQTAAAPRWLAILGLCLASAAWTKNEGFPWLFVGLGGVGLLMVYRAQKMQAGAMLAGIAPLLVTLFTFKMYSDYRGDLFGSAAPEVW